MFFELSDLFLQFKPCRLFSLQFFGESANLVLLRGQFGRKLCDALYMFLSHSNPAGLFCLDHCQE
ncbi:hypothetical protein D3C75_1254200 [compost metagenome]